MTDPSFSVGRAPPRSGSDDQEGLEAALMVLDEYISSGMSDDGDDDDDANMDASMQRGRRSLAHSSSSSSSSRLGIEQPSSPGDATQRRTRSKSVGTPKKAITWDPNKARNERKGELIFLRKRIAQLELKLQRLQGKVVVAAPSSRIHDAPSALLSPASNAAEMATESPPCPIESLALWESISHRQCQERLKAERENIRLKLALERQLKIAKTLDKIVHKKAVIKELERTVLEPTSDADAIATPSTIATTAGANSTTAAAAAFASGVASTSLDLSTLLLLEMHETLGE